jgi:hypothetical protein
MTVSSVTIYAPYSGQDFAEARPHATVAWAGGVGPFDVLYEWDDNAGFTTPITDTNIGVTSPDEGTPPSDMGPFETDWFLRVTVTDNDDAGDLTSATKTLTFTDPTDHPRHLYLNHNVGVGFGIDPFDSLPLGDGEAEQFARFLYLNHNVDSTVPVPWIDKITPTVAETGDTVVIRGNGFDDAPRNWSAEARLYDGPDPDTASFVVMPEVSFVAGAIEDVLTVTVPAGASSGHVAVENTG